MSKLYGHPKHLMEDAKARAALASFDRLALLITHGPDGLNATHLPILFEDGAIIAHVARANPHWRDAPCDALFVLPGAETYVSPSWYESKKRDGRAVPTWNYETIHVHGRLELVEDHARLHDIVANLSARHEAGRPEPWAIGDAPAEYTERLLNAIVGLTLTPTRILGKRKLSQDKPAEDRASVIDALSASPDTRDQAVADAMKAVIPDSAQR